MASIDRKGGAIADDGQAKEEEEEEAEEEEEEEGGRERRSDLGGAGNEERQRMDRNNRAPTPLQLVESVNETCPIKCAHCWKRNEENAYQDCATCYAVSDLSWLLMTGWDRAYALFSIPLPLYLATDRSSRFDRSRRA